MKDFDLNRFLAGQSFDYDWALKEIQTGKKAEAYLRHEVLNARLREIAPAQGYTHFGDNAQNR